MDNYEIKKEDIINRVYFITKLVQNHNGSTMQGALTSKSDSMGGIFDRFINTISDALIFDKIIFQNSIFKAQGIKIEAIEDFYYYKPNKSSAGIAPDILGVKSNNKLFPFTKFNNKWEPVPGAPQIEVKTFKSKDQMITLRNQGYDNQYLVLVDLDLRIDYLVPFLDRKILNESVMQSMEINDSLFIVNDDKNLVTKVSEIDYSNSKIGTLSLISITNAGDFMKQATFCSGGESVSRMKEIKSRKSRIVNKRLNEPLKDYASPSPRNSYLYEFNENWYKKMNIPRTTKCLDFSANNVSKINIIKFNKNGIVISANDEGCSFNGKKLIKEEQYTISFEVLDRSSNRGNEYFIQKECAKYLKSLEDELITDIVKIINNSRED